MRSVLRIVSLSLILSIACAYPYGDQDEEDLYEETPEYIQYVPVLRRARRAVRLPIRNREKVILIPEGMQMRGSVRGDLPTAGSNTEPIAAETGYGHSSHPYDYVDYGAYTGGYGAFGWYSDHPVQTYGNSYH